ncbi:GTPase Era involved in 16S rRNA processing [Parabacteroides sp. PF5-5]|nr:GTPase Era involved in 16S rRNA processing [Parabacteroides sp. PF5-13]MDH6327821.1 GTPase Era involved in 16S rRNA processing [Parabacteroides sp. PH5-41]MDH6335663.1 GTPase Era involved in 16S rRNA processing [Parabacteroides sp. PF5-5]MDH6346685.1 GTPase Era involved in 16S rRNA processing [Parabacteroides sp. PH5-46]MDH6361689.1 GTPase Era involved in 16S rRNA processing [Parabacteroides sp. PH5-16]MDH6377356.1 GTPase Era involved in 16S rRNA processing [Parabacteroides sp. PH5-33]
MYICKIMKEELIHSGKEKIKAYIETWLPLQKDEKITLGLKRLQTAYREFDSKQFIVLVVGAVKSGKSTLVNLFAHEYVSPTHFLECTVRPSIISKDAEEKIYQYTLKQGKDKVEAFTTILDYIRGLREKSETELLSDCKVYELNRHNLDLYVRLNMNEENIRLDNTLITNITTPGGNLINGETIIIDMPGLDGGYANFDDPIYKEIAEHADFIIFVQSSNSAVNKISKEFLNLLLEKNREVPVSLIHNVFDASYWEPEKDKQQQINEQIDFATNIIKEKKFEILNSFSVNLGKVNDAKNYPYIDDLQAEKEKFDKMEEELFLTIKEKRNLIHEKNCVFKVEHAIDKLLTTIAEREKDLTMDKDKMEWLNNKLDGFIQRFRNVEIRKDEIETAIKNLFENKRGDWEREIESLAAIRAKNVMSNGERTSATRKQIDEFAADSTQVIKNYLESEEFKNNVAMKFNDKMKMAYNEIYTELIKFMQENKIPIFFLPSVTMDEVFDFHFDGESGKINRVFRPGGRNKKDVCAIINGRKAMFIGYSEQDMKHLGKLQLSIIPEMSKFYMETFSKNQQLFIDKLCELIKERKKEKAPHYEETVNEMKDELSQFQEMAKKLSEIKGLFNTINSNFYQS